MDQKALTTRSREAALLLMGAIAIAPASRCGSKTKTDDDLAAPPASTAATATVPPIAPTTGTPVSAFVDAGVPEGKTPYDQARAYEANGQYWLARLVLEKKALSADGTKQEAELLANICYQQGDEACIEACGHKLGRKLKFDGGVPKHGFDAGTHAEPDTDLAKARNHALKGELKEARAILDPKVTEGKASKEEIRLLKTVCLQQGDRMCVALCDAKLK